MMNSEIFGLVDDVDEAISRFEKASRPKPVKKVKSRPRPKHSGAPKLEIHHPETPENINEFVPTNVVDVPESLLRAISSGVDAHTISFNNLLLKRLVPLILSYDTATSYSSAALRDGLNLEIEFDEGIRDAVKTVAQLMVMYHFIRKAKLPREIKKRFTEQLTDKFADEALTILRKSNAVSKIQQDLHQLAAVVHTSKGGTQVASREEFDRKRSVIEGPVASKPRRRK